MNKKLRKTIIIILAVVVGCGAIWGILTLVKNLNSKPASVFPVSDIAQTGMYMGGNEAYGAVYSDKIQKVMLSSTQTLTSINVEAGQEVKKGDVLITYDTSLGQLDIQRAEINYERQKIELNKAQNQLANLQAAQTTEALEAKLESLQNELAKEKANTPGYEPVMPTLPFGKYTAAEPYYMADPAEFNIEEAFEKAGSDDIYVVFVTVEGGDYVNYKGMHFIRTATYEEVPVENPTEPTEPTDPSEPTEPTEPTEPETKVTYSTTVKFFKADALMPSESVITDKITQLEDQIAQVEELMAGSYSKAELLRMIDDQYRAIKSADISVRTAELEYRQKLKEVSDGNVYAEMDGTIMAVRTEEEAKSNGSAVVELSAGGGYYVKGSVDEYALRNLEVGQTVQVNSWYTGMTYDGEITEIGTIPTQDQGYSMVSNVSFYPFTVHIQTDDVLEENEYVSIMYGVSEESDAWYLDSMFIRFDADKAYVYVRGENDQLEKRYVQIGKVLWGSAYEIRGGLSMDDWITFPYGKNIFEGAKTKESTIDELYQY